MAVGTQPNWAYINAQATQVVLLARAALSAISTYDTYLQGIGLANLEAMATAAGDADATDDATELLSVFANLAAIATMAAGGPAPSNVPFDFVDQTVPLWNAQYQ